MKLLVWFFPFILMACANVRQSPEIPLERIGIRATSKGRPEFFLKKSERSFSPRGVNWVRLSKMGDDKHAENISFHEGYFKTHLQDITEMLKKISSLGFNVVRIRVDADGISKSGPGLNSSYVENVITFIRIANANRIYVLLTGQWLPKNYYAIASSPGLKPKNPGASDINQLLMSEGTIKAFATYKADLINEIKRKAPELLPGIFALDIWNELYFNSNALPFSEEFGFFRSDNGKKYDLSNRDSRQALADDSAIQWTNEITTAIKKVDSNILVTSSVFTPLEVRRKGYDGVYTQDSEWSDWRQPFRLKALEKSNVDFLQIHPYPHTEAFDFGPDLRSLEYQDLKKIKPIMIGEFGAHKKDFPTIHSASKAIHSFLDEACKEEMAGWLYWTWDTYEQTDLWNLQDENKILAQSLSIAAKNWCRNGH